MPRKLIEPKGDRAAELSSVFRLRQIDFTEIIADLKSPPDPDAALTFQFEFPPSHWLLDDENLFAVVRIGVKTSEKSDPSKAVAVFRTTVRLIYERADAATPENEAVAHYVGIMSFLHAWPYVRAEVQALTLKLGLPGLTLPIAVSGNAENACKVFADPIQVPSDDDDEPSEEP